MVFSKCGNFYTTPIILRRNAVMKEMNKINAANIKHLVCDPGKSVAKIPDGGGLYLWVYPNGNKYWYYRYKYNGESKDYCLGAFEKLSAKEARAKRDECSKIKSEGIDPMNYFNQKKDNNRRNSANTFRAIAERWLNDERARVAENTHKVDLRCYNKDIFPAIGDKPIRDITKDDVWEIIQIVQNRTKKDTNKRVLYRIHKVFEYAIDHDICENDPTVSLKKHLRIPEKENMKAITHDMKEFGELLRVIDAYEPQLTPPVFYCLKLSVLVAARSGDIRKMKWKDIDFEKAEWRYYVSKVKTEYVCPLSRQALELLNRIKEICYLGDDSFVFQSPRERGRCISDGVFHQFFVRSGYHEKQSQHGFRATMQTQLLELGYPRDWTEVQLTHNIAKYGGAYDRATYIDQRRKMMQVWADYIDEIKKPGADYEALKKKYTFSG